MIYFNNQFKADVDSKSLSFFNDKKLNININRDLINEIKNIAFTKKINLRFNLHSKSNEDFHNMIIFCRRYGKVQLRGNLSATLFTAPSQNSTTAFGPHPFSEPMLIFTLTFSIFNSYLHKNNVSLNCHSLVIY